MSIDRDIVVLMWTESDINAGLHLVGLAQEAAGYNAAILVISDSPKLLSEQLKSRLQKQFPQLQDHVVLHEIGLQLDEIRSLLKENSELRLVLLPGLDQLRDAHRHLLRDLDVMVVCYQTHELLCEKVNRDWVLDGDQRGTVQTLRTLLGLERPLRSTTLDELTAEAEKQQQAADQSSETAAEQLAEDGTTNGSQTPNRPLPESARRWHFIPSSVEQLDQDLKRSRQLLEVVSGPVLLVRAEKGWSRRAMRSRWLRRIVRVIPQMEREQRKLLSDQLQRESKPSFDFLALICASSFLAAFGLAQNSAAVIIGAMLVAPLMSPILAAGLALSQGNRALFAQSCRTIVLGFIAALSAGTLFGILLQVLPNKILVWTDEGYVLTQEMWSRTYPGPLDFLVGLVGGSAAAFARTRKELSSALAGAAIAAALVPPIATAGIELSLLLQTIRPQPNHSLDNLVLGPSLLFFCNMLTIMIGSAFVLWACGIRGVHDHSSKERWTVRMIATIAAITVLVFVWIIQH